MISSETLSRLYGVPIEVLRASDGRLVVVGQPEAPFVHGDRHACMSRGLPGALLEPGHDVQQLFAYPFMVNALEAGTIVAVMAGVTGWFMVLRRQTFAGHTLSVIAFPGAAAASLAGVPLALGYFGFCALGALALAAIAGSRRSLSAESAATGSLQALALALGFLFTG